MLFSQATIIKKPLASENTNCILQIAQLGHYHSHCDPPVWLQEVLLYFDLELPCCWLLLPFPQLLTLPYLPFQLDKTLAAFFSI